MRTRLAFVSGLLAWAATAVPAPLALAQDPAPGSPEWYAREAGNVQWAQGRTQDWGSHPSGPGPREADPRRAISEWDGKRGRALAIEYRNRYGARIVGHLWRGAAEPAGPLPAVVFVNGAGSGDRDYHWFAQDLAEHGYLVMTFDPQGQGSSEAEPEARYCEPGDWQKPQEMGIQERGPCAGQDPPESAAKEAFGLTFAVTGKAGEESTAGAADIYRDIAPRFVFGALDATAWLLSPANPWRGLVDEKRLGIAGHSAGAYAALMVANGDPLRRFRAGAALDGYYSFDHGVTGRVPTMIVQGEQQTLLGPRTVPPRDPRDPGQLHPMRAAFADLVARGIDSVFVVLRGSTHYEFNDVLLPASSRGQRVTAALLLDWFGRHLQGAAAGPLHLDRFGDAADRSSIGTGTAAPDRTNVPYAIGGEPIKDHLSFYYPTDVFASGRRCLDRRLNPCPAPRAGTAPCRGAGLRLGRPRLTSAGVVVRLRATCAPVPGVRVSLRAGRRTIARSARLIASLAWRTVRIRARGLHGRRYRVVAAAGSIRAVAVVPRRGGG